MPLTLTIDGLDTSVLPAFTALQADLEAAGNTAAQAGAKRGAEHAKQNHRFKNRTGTLEASIGWRKLVEQGTHPSSEFFTGADYAHFFPDGTKPHSIDPRPGNPTGAMWWNDPYPDGELVHAVHVNHPGTAPDPYMYQATYAAEAETERVLEREVAVACAKADR